MKKDQLEHVKGLFLDHVPKYQKLEGKAGTVVEHLHIRKPGTGIYSADYLCNNGRLFVTGDMYAAIYQWSEGVNMKWISECDLGYFQSKVMAVPAMPSITSRFEDWVREVAKEGLKEEMKNFESQMSLKLALTRIGCAFGYPEEWAEWLRLNDYDGGYTRAVFPGYEEMDGESLAAIHSIGYDTSVICVQHLYGLKDAIEKLGEDYK